MNSTISFQQLLDRAHAGQSLSGFQLFETERDPKVGLHYVRGDVFALAEAMGKTLRALYIVEPDEQEAADISAKVQGGDVFGLAQWLDDFGWQFRKSFVYESTPDGFIYGFVLTSELDMRRSDMQGDRS